MNPSTRPSPLALALTVAGALAVGYALVRTHTEHRPGWVLVVGLVSVVLWAARGFLARAGRRRADLVCTAIVLVSGALVAAPTDGLTVVPAAVAVLVLVSDHRRPIALGLAAAAVAVVLVTVGAVPFGAQVPAVLSMVGGLVLAAVAGVSRRQFRVSEEQAALLRERELQMKEEASRIAIARDLHDVLAHSLGGLVVQLDAVDALLEAGEAAPARTRVVAARGLAVEGLAEARRAVAALRDPGAAGDGTGPVVPPDDFRRTLDDLLSAHRALGAAADLRESGAPRPLGAPAAIALERALQEALSNARKHSPGSPVDVGVRWQDDRVQLTVENPLPAATAALTSPGTPLAASGGGQGLTGMRERFDALPAGGRVHAGAEGGRFVVTAEAMLP